MQKVGSLFRQSTHVLSNPLRVASFKTPSPVVLNRAVPSRSIITYITENDDFDFELEEFMMKARYMGCSKNRGFKVRELKECRRRQNMINKKQGKISNNKVRALVDFVEFKNTFDYQ